MSTRILPEFTLLMPKSINEALEMLAEHKDKATVMAGGTDLLVLMKNGYRNDYVISLAGIPELDYLRYDKTEGLRIGAMATLAQVVESQLVRENYPALWKSTAKNGSPQTRNMGTVVGNLLRASPAGDCCCAVLSLGGNVVLEGLKGRREVSVDDFWLDYRVTARKPDELAIEVKMPPLPVETRTAFSALTRTSLDLAKVNAAVRLDMSQEKCLRARLTLGAVAPTPLRLKKTEQLLEGVAITDSLLKAVEESVSTEISPIDDVRSTAAYRREVAGVLVRRTIKEACNGLKTH